MTATLIFTNVALLLMCLALAHVLHEIKGLKLAVGYLLGKVQKAGDVITLEPEEAAALADLVDKAADQGGKD